MKYIQSITFRALSALCIGSLLIAFPDKTTTWLVIIIGILFLVPGLISITAYFRMRSGQESLRPLFPIIGMGSLLFGILLIVFSGALIDYMMFVLAAFLVLAGISQIVTLLKYRGMTEVGKSYYVIPVIITLAGIFILLNIQSVKVYALTIVGAASIVYGVAELVGAVGFRKVRRRMAMPEKQAGGTAAEETGQDIPAGGKENAATVPTDNAAGDGEKKK